MKLSDFDFYLPRKLIAQHPAARRSSSRMLVVDRRTGKFRDHHFRELPGILDTSNFLVLNDSKVFRARLFGRRGTGGKVEVFLVRRTSGTTWQALIRPSGRIKKGEKIWFDDTSFVTVDDSAGGVDRVVSFKSLSKERSVIARHGLIPLPPYIRREAGKSDSRRYQTVYANKSGSVAAPTAGLHFDRRTLHRLTAAGIQVEMITLHVGPGTFKPVISERIAEHVVDPEVAFVSKPAADRINRYKSEGKKLLAVGTTAVRTLEFISDDSGLVRPFEGFADLYIYPPYRFKAVDLLLTNFHLPRTSLLMLASAFCGHDLLMKAYEHAIQEEYRFYSYGDCLLIL
jgi:S-adenosylmethionine:tRNA ribosyltransferase-isomerase